MDRHELIIVGGGPAGLATAIAASRAGIDYLVIEKAALVNTILHYPTNMVFFTTPELLEIGGFPFTTPHEKPTRVEALRYYRRVVDATALRIAFDERVGQLGVRDAADGRWFDVRTEHVHDGPRVRSARFVVVATGAFDIPNRLGVPGEDLPHVSHYYTEAHPSFRKRVVIVGGKNSAADAALDLYRNGAHVTIVHRHGRLADSIKYWVKPDVENRIREGSIAARFDARVVEIHPTHVLIEQQGVRDTLPADVVLLLTGYLADTAFLAEAGVRIDPASNRPTFDPETLETNVTGLFLAGSVVSGRQRGEVFIENGRFHGQVAVGQVARRLSGAEMLREG